MENQSTYSPGRIVPKGVEILEPDAIGVTISEVKSTLVTDWWNTPHYPVTGTTPTGGFSTATNWDPFASKELIIRLHCTTDLNKAFMDPSPYTDRTPRTSRTGRPPSSTGDGLAHPLLAALLQRHLGRLVGGAGHVHPPALSASTAFCT